MSARVASNIEPRNSAISSGLAGAAERELDAAVSESPMSRASGNRAGGAIELRDDRGVAGAHGREGPGQAGPVGVGSSDGQDPLPDCARLAAAQRIGNGDAEAAVVRLNAYWVGVAGLRDHP